MSGAWEYERPSVFVAILTRGIVPTQWAQSFRALQLPDTARIAFYSGMPFDHARNVAVEQAINHGFNHLMFLDDDVLPPPDVYYRLVAHSADIISGLYHRRQNPIYPVAMIKTETGYGWISEYNRGVINVDLVGAGCLLIHRLVLEKMKKPWFEWLIDREDIKEGERFSEDFAFCAKAQKLGYQILLDTSIECSHAGYGYTDSERKMKPLEQ